MKLSSLLLAVGLVLAPLFPTSGLAAAPKTYAVSLNPGWKMGEKFGIADAATMNMKVVVSLAPPGQPAQPVQQQQQKQSAHLEADAEVLAVYPNGGLQKVALTVKKLTGTGDDTPEKDILPAGAKVVAEKNGKLRTFTVDGSPAPAEAEKFLKLVTSGLIDDPKHTDQDSMGPTDPVAVGGTWPINGEILTEDMKDDFGDAVTCTGTVKLDSIKGEGDSQVAVISGSLTFEHMQPPIPAFVIKSAEGKGELSGLQPATHKGVKAQTMGLTVKLVGETAGPNGAQLSLNMEADQQMKGEITYR